jgi:serine/threonine-protein kinase
MATASGSEGTEIIGRYALHGEIASGGMAIVYLGKLLGAAGFTRPVAIKRLHPQLAREQHVRDMFVDEARLASRIRHPNVVPMLDVVADRGELLLVMDYVHGESLQHLLRAMRQGGERVPLRITLAVMSAVLHGLHAAHEATTETGEPLHIVHRDVSPQNVMVGVDGVPRVLDFGIARAAVRLENTRDGIVKGKLAYMAPEQLGGAVLDRRADVYAAAVMLWEMLAGRRLFVSSDGANVLVDKLLRGDIEPPGTHAPDLPRLLDAITLHGLERNPSQRFATAREMALALEKVGELARPSEIGEWVEQMATEPLAERRHRLQEMEMTSSCFRVRPATVDRELPDLFAIDFEEDTSVTIQIAVSGLASARPARVPTPPVQTLPTPPQAMEVPILPRTAPATRRAHVGVVFAAYMLLGAFIILAAVALPWGGEARQPRGTPAAIAGALAAGAVGTTRPPSR